DQIKAFNDAKTKKRNVLIYYVSTDPTARQVPMSKVFYERDFVDYARANLILLRQSAVLFLQQPGTLEYASINGDTIGFLARHADDYKGAALVQAIEQFNKPPPKPGAKPAKK